MPPVTIRLFWPDHLAREAAHISCRQAFAAHCFGSISIADSPDGAPLVEAFVAQFKITANTGSLLQASDNDVSSSELVAEWHSSLKASDTAVVPTGEGSTRRQRRSNRMHLVLGGTAHAHHADSPSMQASAIPTWAQLARWPCVEHRLQVICPCSTRHAQLSACHVVHIS